MGIAVPRLGLPLVLGQLLAQVELVVAVGPSRGEEGPEGAEEEIQPIAAVVEPRQEAVVQVARGGVERAVEGPAVPGEEISRFRRDPPSHVDGLEATHRLQRQPDLAGRR